MAQTWLMTGATQGIGWACASELARHDDVLLLILARDPERARRLAWRGSTRIIECDLASRGSVKSAAGEIAGLLAAGQLPPLRAMVFNAGMQTASGPWQYSRDGMEIAFATNHLAHFALSCLLARSMTAPGRIVFTASGTHDPDTNDGRFNRAVPTDAKFLAFPDHSGAPAMSHLQRYATTKLCNIYCAYELARRLNASPELRGITSNAFDPGAVPGTGLLREHGSVARKLFSSPMIRWLTRVEKVEDAGAALARLVHDPALEGVTGRYFAGLTQRASSRASYDLRAASALWEQSIALAGLSPGEALEPEPHRHHEEAA